MLTSAKVKVFVPITDAEKAKSFYQGTLGFTLLTEDSYGLEFALDHVVLRLSMVGQHQPAQFTILGWKVTDIYSAVADLEARGVIFEKYGFENQDERGVWAAPGGTKVAWFKDPFGNTLSVDD